MIADRHTIPNHNTVFQDDPFTQPRTALNECVPAYVALFTHYGTVHHMSERPHARTFTHLL